MNSFGSIRSSCPSTCDKHFEDISLKTRKFFYQSAENLSEQFTNCFCIDLYWTWITSSSKSLFSKTADSTSNVTKSPAATPRRLDVSGQGQAAQYLDDSCRRGQGLKQTRRVRGITPVRRRLRATLVTPIRKSIFCCHCRPVLATRAR